MVPLLRSRKRQYYRRCDHGSPRQLSAPHALARTQYGLMTANPFGHSYFYGDESRRGHHTLSQGESLVGIYRYYFHKGDATDGNIRERYHDFAHPPVIDQD